MDTLTKFSAFVIFCIGTYCLLTIPHTLLFMSDGKIGFSYPMWLLALMAAPSAILGNIITNWADKKAKLRKNE
jgi:hypothetical protein